jgi:hypothetical protein
MSLGNVALGLASLAFGVHHLRNGVRRLSAPSGHPLEGMSARRAMPAPGLGKAATPISLPGKPFMTSDRRPIITRGGVHSMQMRSFNIRTLDDRMQYLRKLADEGKRDPAVYAFARRAITARCGNDWCIPEKDNVKEARAIFGAQRRRVPPRMTARDVGTARNIFKGNRRHVRYTSDIMGVDTYQKPAHTLALRTGDCDDYSTLTCAELGSVGIPCRYKVIRTRGAKDWNHIYPQAGFPRANPTRWISMDSSVNMPFGWEAPRRMVAASRVFRVH